MTHFHIKSCVFRNNISTIKPETTIQRWKNSFRYKSSTPQFNNKVCLFFTESVSPFNGCHFLKYMSMPLNAIFTHAHSQTMHLKGCHFGTLVPQSPYVSLNSLAYLVQYVQAQAILYSLNMTDIKKATIAQSTVRKLLNKSSWFYRGGPSCYI